MLMAVKVIVMVPPGATASLVVFSKKRMIPGIRLGSYDQFTVVPPCSMAVTKTLVGVIVP